MRFLLYIRQIILNFNVARYSNARKFKYLALLYRVLFQIINEMNENKKIK
jgi:hypothetical protein